MPVEGVKLTMEYFIDKRVFVTGRKSVLSLDNPFNLTAFTNSQISLMGVSCAQNGLNIQTALDPITGTQTNCTELGGTLLHGTTVTGGGHQFAFDTVDLDFTGDFWFTQYTETIAIRSAQTLMLRGDSTVKFVTPSIVASTGTAGQILTLQSSAGPVTGGACEWADPSAAMLLNIYTGNGSLTANRTLDGAGAFNLSFIELNDFIVETVNNVSFIEGSAFLINDYASFTISQTNIIDIEATTAIDILTGGDLTLQGGTQLSIKTPSVGSVSPPSIGDVLTLSSVLGECEWAVAPGGIDTSLSTHNQTLIADRTVDGATGFNLFFNNSDFIGTQTGVTDITWSGSGTTIIHGNTLKITEGVSPMVGKAVADVLTLTNATTGECEWQAPAAAPLARYVQTFVVADWVTPSVILPFPATDITILASTHGKGTTPIVQAQISGKTEPPVVAPAQEAVVTTDQTGGGGFSAFGAITILSNGDIVLTTLVAYGPATSGTYGVNGTVIIM